MTQKEPLHKQIEHDHEELHVTMRAMAGHLDCPADASAFKAWKLNLLRELRDFQNDLQKHFDLEEEGTYKDELLRTAPQFARVIDHLEIEHEQVITDLNEILGLLKSVQSADSPIVAQIKELTMDVFKLLESHEAQERTLIQDVYYQDYGAGD